MAAPIGPLAWEPPYALDAALKRQKKKKKGVVEKWWRGQAHLYKCSYGESARLSVYFSTNSSDACYIVGFICNKTTSSEDGYFSSPSAEVLYKTL